MAHPLLPSTPLSVIIQVPYIRHTTVAFNPNRSLDFQSVLFLYSFVLQPFCRRHSELWRNQTGCKKAKRRAKWRKRQYKSSDLYNQTF